METAFAVKKAGATFLRGGAYKPRTSPYSFQGLEEEGLKYMKEAREATGLNVICEVTSAQRHRGGRHNMWICSRSAPETCRTLSF